MPTLTAPESTNGNRSEIIEGFAALLAAEANPHKREGLHKRAELMAAQSEDVLEAAGSGLLAQRRLLGALVRDGVPPPTWLASERLGERLFYAESTWIVSGHKKSGKSMAVMATGLDVIDSGRPVVYLDFENGHKRFARRLIQLAADADAVDEYLHYIGAPRGLTLDGMGDELDAIREALPGVFVVVDSLRGYMARLSPPGRPLDPNVAQDVEAVCAPLNDAAHEGGLTIGIIDHAKKGASETDEYSTSGSQAKEAAVDAVYFWTKVEPFSKAQAGLVKIAPTSDRDGELDFGRYYRVGGQGDGPIRFDRADADEVGTMGKIRSAVFDYLADREGEKFPKTQVTASVKGKAEHVLKALDLVEASEPHVHKEPNPRRKDSWLYFYDSSHETGADGADL